MSHKGMKELLTELKKHKGSIREIANRAGVQRSTVWRALKGSSDRPDVIIMAAQVLQDRKRQRKEQLSKLDSMVAQALAV